MSEGISKAVSKIATVFAATLCIGAQAQTTDPLIKAVTLCSPGEQTIMTGRMQTSKMVNQVVTFTPNGKFASLCADANSEPIMSLVYRYGKPGAIEMEAAASKAQKFFTYYDQGGPNFGSNVVWFTKGEYRYEIGAGVGMARGVSVKVFRGAKIVVDLFSGLEEEDHYSRTEDIDFAKPKSPVLAAKRPN
jgi:hypothetical protein